MRGVGIGEPAAIPVLCSRENIPIDIILAIDKGQRDLPQSTKIQNLALLVPLIYLSQYPDEVCWDSMESGAFLLMHGIDN